MYFTYSLQLPCFFNEEENKNETVIISVKVCIRYVNYDSYCWVRKRTDQE